MESDLLDLSGASKSLWLVKVPHFIAEQWDAHAQDGDVVGKLQIATVPVPGRVETAHQISVQLSVGGEESGAVEEFVLAEIPLGTQVLAFESNPETERFKVRGKIGKSYNMNPRDDEAYRKAIRERTINSQKVKEVKSISVSVAQAQSAAIRDVDFIPPRYAEAKQLAAQSGTSLKRQRAEVDGKDVRSRVLQAFSEKDRLTFKELMSMTQAPERDLKEQLKNLADFHFKGPYRNFWELKLEYRAGTNVTLKG
jgi:hypothetical protein